MNSLSNVLENNKIKMEIIEFTTNRPKRGRRGSPAILEGMILFAIKYIFSKGGYFTFSYQNKKDAETVINNMKLYGSDNEYYYYWNVVNDIQDTLHVSSR